MWKAGKRSLKEHFRIWTLCVQKGTDALPRRKDVRKGKPVGNGGIEVVVTATQLKPQNGKRECERKKDIMRFLYLYLYLCLCLGEKRE